MTSRLVMTTGYTKGLSRNKMGVGMTWLRLLPYIQHHPMLTQELQLLFFRILFVSRECIFIHIIIKLVRIPFQVRRGSFNSRKLSSRDMNLSLEHGEPVVNLFLFSQDALKPPFYPGLHPLQRRCTLWFRSR